VEEVPLSKLKIFQWKGKGVRASSARFVTDEEWNHILMKGKGVRASSAHFITDEEGSVHKHGGSQTIF
jgi:hypothetical protein